MNDNEVEDWQTVHNLQQNKQLATIYLEHNPIAADTGYRRKLKLAVSWLKQIDATLAA
jgi:protein phosphatase 1 regulatory subunit 7